MSTKDKDDLLTCGLTIVGAVILLPLVVILQGWVLSVLWSWFVVPTFRLPELSIPVAYGLILIAGMFKSYTINPKKKTTQENIIELVAYFLVPLSMLFFGWIVQMFM